MDKAELLKIMQEYPTMQLASIGEGGFPSTRAIWMYSADENGIVFHTGKFRDLYKELSNNKKVEVSFFDPERFVQLRVKGFAVEIDNNALREKIVATPGREFLKPLVEKEGIDVLRVFKISQCRATFWSWENNTVYPKPVIEFA